MRKKVECYNFLKDRALLHLKPKQTKNVSNKLDECITNILQNYKTDKNIVNGLRKFPLYFFYLSWKLGSQNL